jgi:hypothetical protein
MSTEKKYKQVKVIEYAVDVFEKNSELSRVLDGLHCNNIRVTIEVEVEAMTEQRANNIIFQWIDSDDMHLRRIETWDDSTRDGEKKWRSNGTNGEYSTRIQLAEALLEAYPELEEVE